jgi:hypothetical protein
MKYHNIYKEGILLVCSVEISQTIMPLPRLFELLKSPHQVGFKWRQFHKFYTQPEILNFEECFVIGNSTKLQQLVLEGKISLGNDFTLGPTAKLCVN